jgi:hypothetical protein
MWGIRWKVEWEDYRWYAVLRGELGHVIERHEFVTEEKAKRYCDWQNAIPYRR